MRFEIHQGRHPGKGNPWYWRARASNGQITAQSEGYSRKASVKRALTCFVYSILSELGVPFSLYNSANIKYLIVEVDK